MFSRLTQVSEKWLIAKRIRAKTETLPVAEMPNGRRPKEDAGAGYPFKPISIGMGNHRVLHLTPVQEALNMSFFSFCYRSSFEDRFVLQGCVTKMHEDYLW